jgi:hypothetical protein
MMIVFVFLVVLEKTCARTWCVCICFGVMLRIRLGNEWRYYMDRLLVYAVNWSLYLAYFTLWTDTNIEVMTVVCMY